MPTGMQKQAEEAQRQAAKEAQRQAAKALLFAQLYGGSEGLIEAFPWIVERRGKTIYFDIERDIGAEKEVRLLEPPSKEVSTIARRYPLFGRSSGKDRTEIKRRRKQRNQKS